MRQRIIAIKNEEISLQDKCSLCTGSKCCTYITQHITTPRSKADFDYLLWQISHGNIKVYKDSDGWFLLIESKCHHILADGQCGIYETRPQICRDYSNDFCEYDAPAEESFELYFNGYDALMDYCRKRFKRWDRWLGER